MLRAILFCCVVFLVSCTNIQKSPSTHVILKASDPDKVRFSGKGAGAGMMLMSSMGPMGIAIGVAIDEGIAKDIDETASGAGVTFSETFKHAFNNQVGDVSRYTFADYSAEEANVPEHDIFVEVLRYGFITRRGDNDPVSAEIHVRYSINGGETHEIKYPQELDGNENVVVDTRSLDEVKADAKAAEELWASASQYVVSRIMK